MAERVLSRRLVWLRIVAIAGVLLQSAGPAQARPFEAPAVSATLAAALATDVNGDGKAGPADTVRYTGIVSNTGDTPATSLNLSLDLDPNTTYQPGTLLSTPLVYGKTVTTTEDTAITITLDGFSLGPITPTFSVQTAPAQGVLGSFVPLSGVSANVVYTPSANFNGADSFVVRLTNPQGTDTAGVNVVVLSINDAPQVDLNGPAAGSDFTTSFSEGGAPTPVVAATATVIDVDSALLQLAVITLTNPINGPLESLTATVAGTAIQAVYDQPAGALRLTGPDSVANFQQVLRTATYRNASRTPDTSNRLLRFAASDGALTSSPVTTTLQVTPVNNPPIAATDIVTTSEDSPVNIDVLANDSDADGSLFPGSVSVSVAPQHGQATPEAATGRVIYTPTVDYNGTDSFTYTVCDTGTPLPSACASAPVTITVTAVNDAPIVDLNGAPAGIGYAAVFTEGMPPVPATSASAIVTDVDSSLLVSMTIVLTTRPDGPSETITATGSPSITVIQDSRSANLTLSGPATPISFQAALRTVLYANTALSPTAGVRDIVFQAFDGLAASAPATTTVQVNPVNNAPVLTDNAVSTAEDEAVEIDILADDTDADGILVPSSVSVTGVISAGVVTVNPVNGRITFTPTQDFNGVVAFGYQACDSGSPLPAICGQARITVTVTPVTDAPVVDLNGGSIGRDYASGFTEGAGPVLIVAGGATVTDPDSPVLTAMTATITNRGNGPSELLSVNTAGTAVVASFSIAAGVLTVSGPAPIADFQTVLRTLTYENTSQNPTLTDRLIQVSASDGGLEGPIATATVTMTAINNAPSVRDDTSTINEDGVADVDVLANDTDADSTMNPASVAIVTPPAAGAATVSSANGHIVFTPTLNANGIFTLTYSACDSGSPLPVLCGQATVTVTVAAVNDAPVIGNTAAVTFTEDGGAITLAAGVTVSDPDNANLASATVLITDQWDGAAESLAANVTGTSITANYVPGTGTLTLTGPDTLANFQAVLRTVTYNNTSQNPNPAYRLVRITANDGTTPSIPVDIAVNIVAINDPPNVVPDTATVNEDAWTTISVLTNDLDIEGSMNAASVTVTVSPLHGAAGVNTTTGQIIYTPTANYSGTDTLTYQACDLGAPLPALCGTAVVTITVTGVNDPPNAVADSVTTPEEAPITISVLANDSDVDGSVVTATLVITVAPASGTATANTLTGQIVYTPALDYNGAVTLTYQICDNGLPLPSACATALVTVTVTPVNDRPIYDANGAAAGLNYSMVFTKLQGSKIVAAADATLTDVDSPNMASASITLTNRPDGANEFLTADTSGTSISANYSSATGILTLSGTDTKANYQQVLRTVAYSNTVAFPDGSDRIVVATVFDGEDSSSPVTTTITVINNFAPVGGLTTAQTVGNTQLFFGAAQSATPSVLSTGSILDTSSDPDGGPQALKVVPASGTGNTAQLGDVTIDATGAFTYVPKAGFTGVDTFTAVITDGLATATAAVSVTVLSPVVWYVQNTAAAGGDGRSNKPFNTLAAAQTASAVGDTIYVRTGDGTSTGQNAGITLKTNQQLKGEGDALSVAGLLSMPAGTRPQIANAGGSAVTGASGVRINGLNIAGATQAGIQLPSISAAVFVTNVTVLDAATSGISITNSSAQIDFSAVNVTTSTVGLDVLGGSSKVNLSGNLAGRRDAVAQSTTSGGAITVTGNLLAAAGGVALTSNSGAASFLQTSGASSFFATGARPAVSLQNSSTSSLTFQTGAAVSIVASGGSAGVSANGGTLNFPGGSNTLSVNGAAAITVTNTNLGASQFADFDVTNGAVAGLITSTGTLTLNSASGTGSPNGPLFHIQGGSANLSYSGSAVQNAVQPLIQVTGGHSGSVTISGGSENAAAGSGFQFSGANGTYNITGLLSGGSSAQINIANSTGTFAFGTPANVANLSTTNIASFVVNGGSPTVNYYGTVAQTGPFRAVDIQSTTGGSVTFASGTVTGNNQSTGVNLASVNGTVTFAAITMGSAGSRLNSNAVKINGGTGTISLGVVNLYNNSTTTLDSAYSGTVNITSGTVDAASGTAVNFNGGTLGVDLTKVNASGATDGVVVANTAGRFAVNGTGGYGTGGLIQNMSGRGVSASSAVSVALRGVDILNTATTDGGSCDVSTNTGCNAGVHFASVNGAELTNVKIHTSGQEGFNGNTVTNLVMRGVSIQDAGNAVFEHAVRIRELRGPNNLIASSYMTAAGSGGAGTDKIVEVVNTVASVVTDVLTIDSSRFSGTNLSSNGNDGVEVYLQGTANFRLNLSNSTIANTMSNGLQVAVINTAKADVNVTNNTFLSTPIGIDLSPDDTAQLTFDINGNSLDAKPAGGAINGGTVINLAAFGNATTEGKIRNNPSIKHGGSPHNGAGIRVSNEESANTRVSITNNTITNVALDDGIFLESRARTSTANPLGRFDVRVDGNTVGVLSGVANAIHVRANHNNLVCANVTNNLVNAASPGTTNVFRERTVAAGATVQLQGFTTNITNTWAANGNLPIAAGGALFSESNNGTLAAGTCTTPLLLGNAAPEATVFPSLTQADVAVALDAAIARWAGAGLPAVMVERLRGVDIQLADLPEGRLADTFIDEIRVDRRAAGRGWFVDATPMDDREFVPAINGRTLRAVPGAASGRVDLISVVLHELGHVAMLRHEDPALLATTLDPGVRLLPALPGSRGALVNALVAQPPGAGPAAGPTALAPFGVISIPSLPAGKSVRFTFDVTVNNPLPLTVDKIAAQGTLTGQNIPAGSTDDPSTAAAGDATVLPVIADAPGTPPSSKVLYLPRLPKDTPVSSAVAAAAAPAQEATGIALLNLGSATANVTIHAFLEDGSRPAGFPVGGVNDSVPVGGAKTYFSGNINDPIFKFVSVGSRVSLRITGDQPIAATINLQRDGPGTGGETLGTAGNPFRVGSSQAVPEEAAGQTVYAPQVPKNVGGYNARVLVQNGGDVAAQTTWTVFDDLGQPAASFSQAVPAGAGYEFSPNSRPETSGLPDGSYSLRVTGANATDKLAMEVYFLNTGNTPTTAQLLAFTGSSRGSATLFGPRVVRRYYGFSSGIRVQNAGTQATDIRFTYQFAGQTFVYVIPGVQPGRSVGPWLGDDRADNKPANLPNGVSGSVKIESLSGQPLLGNVNEDEPVIGQGSSYNLMPLARATNTVRIPQLVSEVGNFSFNGRNAGFSSGLQYQNVGSATASCTVTYSMNGRADIVTTSTLAPGQSTSEFMPRVPGMGAAFQGSATVSCNQPVLAISNISIRYVGASPDLAGFGDSLATTEGWNQ